MNNKRHKVNNQLSLTLEFSPQNVQSACSTVAPVQQRSVIHAWLSPRTSHRYSRTKVGTRLSHLCMVHSIHAGNPSTSSFDSLNLMPANFLCSLSIRLQPSTPTTISGASVIGSGYGCTADHIHKEPGQAACRIGQRHAWSAVKK